MVTFEILSISVLLHFYERKNTSGFTYLLISDVSSHQFFTGKAYPGLEFNQFPRELRHLSRVTQKSAYPEFTKYLQNSQHNS